MRQSGSVAVAETAVTVGAGAAGGWVGGAAGGAAAGLVCGPGAPVCSGVLAFAGALGGAFVSGAAGDAAGERYIDESWFDVGPPAADPLPTMVDHIRSREPESVRLRPVVEGWAVIDPRNPWIWSPWRLGVGFAVTLVGVVWSSRFVIDPDRTGWHHRSRESDWTGVARKSIGATIVFMAASALSVSLGAFMLDALGYLDAPIGLMVLVAGTPLVVVLRYRRAIEEQAPPRLLWPPWLRKVSNKQMTIRELGTELERQRGRLVRVRN